MHQVPEGRLKYYFKFDGILLFLKFSIMHDYICLEIEQQLQVQNSLE